MSVQEERIVEIPLTESPTPPLVTTEVDELFNESLQELKGRIVDKEVNAATLMIILRVSMEIVEATRLKGADQKELAKRLIRQVVVDAPIADEREKLLLDMIDQNVIENTIDLIVAATRGELDINSVQEVVKTCCLPFVSKLVKKYT
jgi:hypothetical protein